MTYERNPATARRAAADARRRAAGDMRVSVWLPRERVAELDELIERWRFSGREQAIEVAVAYLGKQTAAGLKRITLT